MIRCHTVPQFYLNYFLPPGSSNFWVYDKKVIGSRSQTPINTTVISDYYVSSPDKEAEKETQMESLLSLIEGKAKLILDKWKSNPSEMDEGEKEIIALFLSFMHSRVPRSVDIMKETSMIQLDSMIEEMKKLSLDPAKLKKQYEDFQKSEEGKDCKVPLEQFKQLMVNPYKFVKFVVNEKYAIGQSFSTIQIICDFLLNMNWSIYVIRNKRFFVTGDAPLIVFAMTDSNKAIFGAGFGLPNVEIAFPLSPRLCLWLDKRNGQKCRITGADFIEEINRRSIHMAERFVISPYKSNRIQKVVKELSVHYGKPKIDVSAFKKLFIQKNVKISHL